ncbi:MAG: DNA-directed RNA polymerase [Candidatus Thermoplasmatota archaeon]|jgi:DNA-directed RNA polymerase subunit E'|nr:DNA-directed RNA polymerase [Candidatus Thermoplasmatota archaeon]
MYVEVEDEYVARIPPDKLSEDYDRAMLEVTKASLEGKLVDFKSEGNENNSPGKYFVISILSAEPIGDGVIVHGDGGVYQTVRYSALGYYLEMQEIVEGLVVSVQPFGLFVRFGPFEGLLHKSQIMDDRIDIDAGSQRLIGKDTKKEIKVGDKLRVRVVSLNLSSLSAKDSKIGLTMKQVGLGKPEWLAKKVES